MFAMPSFVNSFHDNFILWINFLCRSLNFFTCNLQHEDLSSQNFIFQNLISSKTDHSTTQNPPTRFSIYVHTRRRLSFSEKKNDLREFCNWKVKKMKETMSTGERKTIGKNINEKPCEREDEAKKSFSRFEKPEKLTFHCFSWV